MKSCGIQAPSQYSSLAYRSKVETPSTSTRLSRSTPVVTKNHPINFTGDLCEMVRSSERSLANLSSSGTLLLFTPAITPAGKAANKTEKNIDPFEMLGRALSRYHKRIRHVPYVPKIGFTETHDAFMSQADAVVVVICEPESGKHEGLGNQGDFADAANEGLDNNSFARPLPLILIQCGDPKGNFWPDVSQFDTVVKCRTYDSEATQQVARKLFAPSK